MTDLQKQLRLKARLMTKRLEMEMFGVKAGKQMYRHYRKNNWWGKIVHHEYVDVREDQLENIVLKRRVTRTGIYKYFKELG